MYENKIKSYKVTFIIPVLNGEKFLNKCLKSITSQIYRKDLIEIIVADGGSTDSTVNISKKYKCKIINNPRKKAEYGHEEALKIAKGDIIIYFAADNILPCKDWVKKIIKPFEENKKIIGVYTHISTNKKDNLLNQYYSNLHVEPFSWFVYGDSVNPRLYSKIYQILIKKENYFVFKLPTKNFPLIAWAQGFAVRKSFKRSKKTLGDDMLPVIQIIKEKKLLAYVHDAGIYHDHIVSFSHYLDKYQSRIRESFRDKNIGYLNREKFFSKKRKILKYIWMLYSISIIGPLYHSILWFLKKRDISYIYHAPCCFFLGILIFYEYTLALTNKLKQKLILLV